MEGAAEGGCHKRGCVGGWRRDEAIAYLEAFYPFHPRLGACHCACVCVAMTCVSSAAIAPACACACLLFSATACASTPMLLQARPTCTAIHTTSRPCPTKSEPVHRQALEPRTRTPTPRIQENETIESHDKMHQRQQSHEKCQRFELGCDCNCALLVPSGLPS